MADQLATPDDLALILGLDSADDRCTLLAECGTAVVQGVVGGQRIVFVADDTFGLMGTVDRWLQLPQWPVAQGDVTDVTVDDQDVIDFKQFGARLWRSCGWAPNCYEPSFVAGVYSHGYPDGDQGLQLGRSVVLSIVKGAYPPSAGLASESIDDYTVAYDRLSAQMDASPFLQRALRAQYGSRAGVVRLG